MYKYVFAPVAGHLDNPVWTDERGSVIRSDADLLAAGTAVCHRHLQVQNPAGPGPGQFLNVQCWTEFGLITSLIHAWIWISEFLYL